MTYQEALDYLYESLPMFQKIGAQAFKKNLDNTYTLAAKLNNPHSKFKSIHIAGTNGKGTSAHALAAILQSAGYKTGLYTSPHLKSFTERIRINGDCITEEKVVEFVENNRPHLEEIKPSFFETTVIMAFDYFAKADIDLAIVEVGMGGRLDSTNIITPEVALITKIGLDHQQFLGNTLPAIAAEKAGIIKKDKPVVIGADQPELLGIFEEKAKDLNAPLAVATDTIVKAVESSYSLVQGDNSLLSEFHPSIQSEYFLENIPGVVTVIDQLRNIGYDINSSAIKNGLENIQSLTGLKGRWQMLNTSPLTICDVGHNLDGIKQVLKQISKISYNQLHIVFGTVADKSIDEILTLLPNEANYYFCQADIPRALPAKQLAEVASGQGLNGSIHINVNEALKLAELKAKPDDLIFIGGSTFIVAEIEGL